MARYKPYERYKDSGVEWIGEIPEHWQVKKIKHFCTVNPSKTELKHVLDKTEVTFLPMESIGTDGTLDLQYTRPISDVISGYTYCAENDIIVAKITPCFENGKGAVCRGLMNGVAFGTTELFVLRAVKDTLHKHVYYITKCQPFRTIGEAMMQGAAGQKRVTENFISDFIVGLPPREEQQAVADFLDQKTSEIDGLVADKEKLVSLLQEYRQAIISEAVTKGLNPDVKMKDSGVEWIGEIPEHWEVSKLKRLCLIVTGNTPPKSDEENYRDGVFEWVKPDNIEDDGNISASAEKLSHAGVLKARLVPKGSTVVCCIGTVGKVGMATQDIATNQQINSVVFEKLDLWQSKFGFYALKSSESEHQRYANKVVVAILNKNSQGNILMPAPPTEEQKAIADYLDQKTAEIDDLISGIQESIDQLKSYRQSLISEAVTGKIDVRGVI